MDDVDLTRVQSLLRLNIFRSHRHCLRKSQHYDFCMNEWWFLIKVVFHQGFTVQSIQL